MPVNAPAEYFAAEERFKSARAREEKIAALEEMIRLLPKHHGSEALHAQLKSRLAKLKKETSIKRGGRSEGITKEGDAQICLIGFANSGKSTLLNALTNADAPVAAYKYTTTEPIVGMIDYHGIKIQLVEIPATLDARHISIARTADAALLLVSSEEEKKQLKSVLKKKFLQVKNIAINPRSEKISEIKEKIWDSTGLIIVKTRNGEPMALQRNATVRDFAKQIHKDFVARFRFARIWRKLSNKTRTIQAGLEYKLKDGDVVEIHTK